MEIKLVITRLENGQVQVQGPINDKFLSYAMLESARDAIKDHTDALAKEPQIMPVSMVPQFNGRRQ